MTTMNRIEINSSAKINILQDALKERYHAQHVIRERVQNVSLWTLGILLAAAGWLIQTKTALNAGQKWAFSLVIAAAFIVLRFFYLKDLERGFETQQKVAARIEGILGLYEKEFFDDLGESVYPLKWKDAGSRKDGRFFKSNYLLLYTGFTILIIAVWFYGCL